MVNDIIYEQIDSQSSLVADVSYVAWFGNSHKLPKKANLNLFFKTLIEDVNVLAIANFALYYQIDEKARYKEDNIRPRKVFPTLRKLTEMGA